LVALRACAAGAAGRLDALPAIVAVPPADWMRCACGPAIVAVPPADRMACSAAAACARAASSARSVRVGERCFVHVHLEALHQHELDCEGEGVSGAARGKSCEASDQGKIRVRVSG